MASFQQKNDETWKTGAIVLKTPFSLLQALSTGKIKHFNFLATIRCLGKIKMAIKIHLPMQSQPTVDARPTKDRRWQHRRAIFSEF
ncbi:hypothetical protein O181_117339, partial [Austropuccinia psidii MF-1]|nr:hypothetical protein [Austropuccinia psidii MF-1]